jgi:hypothetical protein
MFELLSRFHPGELIGLSAVVGGLVVGAIAVVMGIGLEMRKIELAAALKKDMIERGMTPEEIRTVMEAGQNHPHANHKPRRYSEV